MSFAPVIAALATTLLAAPDVEPTVIDVAGPAPVFATLVLPPQGLERLSSTFLFNAMKQALSATAEADVVPLEGAAYEACTERKMPRTLCIVRTALPEQERGRGGRFLAVISVRITTIADKEEEVVAVLLIDLDRARALDTGGDAAAVDRSIRREAVVLRAPPTLLPSPDEATRFLTQQLAPLGDAIRDVDPLDANAELGITTSTGGVNLFIDDREVARIGDVRAVELRRVQVGKRRIAARGPHIEPFETDIALAAGRRRTLDLELTLANPPIYGGVYTGMRWGGIAAAAVGTGLTIWAPFVPKLYRTLDDGEEEVASKLVVQAQVGLPLLAVGITWAVLGFLRDDPKRFPWWELLAGAVVGGAVLMPALLVER
ncbi:MAG: hypothetical protein RIT81_30905 [Deltaproteobacteria bacterium]